MVELNVVQLEYQYVRECVTRTQNQLVSLETERLGLESSIKDRLELVAAERHRQSTLRRELESERMRLSVELKDRTAQLDRLRSRSVHTGFLLA